MLAAWRDNLAADAVDRRLLGSRPCRWRHRLRADSRRRRWWRSRRPRGSARCPRSGCWRRSRRSWTPAWCCERGHRHRRWTRHTGRSPTTARRRCRPPPARSQRPRRARCACRSRAATDADPSCGAPHRSDRPSGRYRPLRDCRRPFCDLGSARRHLPRPWRGGGPLSCLYPVRDTCRAPYSIGASSPPCAASAAQGY